MWVFVLCFSFHQSNQESSETFYILIILYSIYNKGPVPQWVRWLEYIITHTSLSSKRRGFAPDFVIYQFLAHGWWFSPGTPASSTTKTSRHHIVEILLQVALKHEKQKSNQYITLKYNYTQYQISNLILNVFVYWFYCSTLSYNTITSIKSDTFNNLRNLYSL